MKKWQLTFTLICLFIFQMNIIAQHKDDITINGKIIESDTKKPVEFATIRIYNKQDELLSGSISDQEGDFQIQSPEKDIYLKIDFVGFDPLIIKEYQIKQNQIQFGIISMTMDSKRLNEVQVTGQKSQIEFKTDKRVFNVGQDLTSAGGSALDVLNNVPSVDVNIEGTVSLRGNSNVLILINGKPSVITEGNSLGTITAEMIEKVEVITNPSAKYDAEGTSGILNLVLKKEDRRGTNGAITVNTGTPHNHSVGLSLNHRTENFNLFGQLGAGYRRFKSTTQSYSIDKTINNPGTFYTDGDGEKNEQFYNVILGTDYHINPLNILTLSGHFGYEIEDESALLNYRNVDNQNKAVSKIRRNEDTDATNPKMEYQLNYEKSFEDNEEHKLTAHASGSYFGKDKSSDFNNTNLLGDGADSKQKSSTDFSEMEYDFSVDYTHPFSESNTLEIGAKYILEQLTNDYSIANYKNKVWLNDANYTNKFEYDQGTSGLYATFDQKFGNFGIKAGLRMEHTSVSTMQHTNNSENKNNYTDLFPSAHASYKFTNGLSMQAGYSRRISRPDIWDVNPFFSIRDAYNIRTGNPNLKPEYTNAYEITTVKIWAAATVSGSFFHRHTTDAFSDVIKVEDDVTINTTENIGKSRNTGLELNTKTEPTRWMALLLDGNYQYYNREGSYKQQSFDFNSNNWSLRFTTKLKLPSKIDVEMRLRHNSDYKDVQSTYKASTTMDMGIRKKLLKGRGVIHLSMNNVLDTDKRTSVSDQPTFYRFDEHSRDGRRFILGFSFGFGKGEAMEFSGEKMF